MSTSTTTATTTSSSTCAAWSSGRSAATCSRARGLDAGRSVATPAAADAIHDRYAVVFDHRDEGEKGMEWRPRTKALCLLWADLFVLFVKIFCETVSTLISFFHHAPTCVFGSAAGRFGRSSESIEKCHGGTYQQRLWRFRDAIQQSGKWMTLLIIVTDESNLSNVRVFIHLFSFRKYHLDDSCCCWLSKVNLHFGWQSIGENQWRYIDLLHGVLFWSCSIKRKSLICYMMVFNCSQCTAWRQMSQLCSLYLFLLACKYEKVGRDSKMRNSLCGSLMCVELTASQMWRKAHTHMLKTRLYCLHE